MLITLLNFHTFFEDMLQNLPVATDIRLLDWWSFTADDIIDPLV